MIKIVGDDMWDPNNWVEDGHEHRIYADESLEVYAVVDAIDYPYLSQFRWSLHTSRKHKYLRRALHEGLGRSAGMYESPITGKLVRDKKRIQRTRFLHAEIMQRTGIKPPTPAHKEVDHIDRNELNCRRYNLQWATRSMQIKNSSAVMNLKSYKGKREHTELRGHVVANGSDGPCRGNAGVPALSYASSSCG